MSYSHGFIFHSPLGDLAIQGTETHIQYLKLAGPGSVSREQPGWQLACETQLNEYFTGRRQAFNLPIEAQGTLFQQQVWAELCKIANGELASYQQLASACNNPKAVRAVASANANNPIWILIPCHRVIGSDRALRGYAGGLERKAELLKLEGHQLSSSREATEKTRVLS